ncbi:MAG: hypothetical protein H6671_12725 [Anaerolineaceae bacterium]|nr:hypothetical protein [Anaerolineaceae bacterium]
MQAENRVNLRDASERGKPRRRFDLVGVLAVAAAARLLLLASGTVSFHADEAVVGLMARHILQGERPTFFYGQAYMGSLDAWAVALGFGALGESVLTIRIVQSVLYLLVVALGWQVAWRISGNRIVAGVAGLALAVPTVNVALYTTATLGGYNETLLLGGLLLWLGYGVSQQGIDTGWNVSNGQPHRVAPTEQDDFVGAGQRACPEIPDDHHDVGEGLRPSPTGRRGSHIILWLLLGVVAGVGWWANGLIVVYAMPAGLLVLYRVLRPQGNTPSGLVRRSAPLLLALAGFVIGSAPWWVFDFTHNHAALQTFLSSTQTGEFSGIGLPYVPPGQRALGLVIAGIPALVGMRSPWSADFFALPVGVIALVIYGVAVFRLLRGHNPLRPDGRGLVLGMLGLFMAVFVASTFGADPTGRYFVPLALPIGILLGTLAAGLWTQLSGKWRALPVVLVALVIGYQAAGQWSAASTPPGLTTQFDPVSHIANDHDAELIAFLTEHELYNGCTNYWVAFRLAFLSDEMLQYSSALPYKANLSYNAADNRYAPYIEATNNAANIAYITTNLPELDTRLQTAFAERGLSYQQTQIGSFQVYYDFSPEMPLPCVWGE